MREECGVVAVVEALVKVGEEAMTSVLDPSRGKGDDGWSSSCCKPSQPRDQLGAWNETKTASSIDEEDVAGYQSYDEGAVFRCDSGMLGGELV